MEWRQRRPSRPGFPSEGSCRRPGRTNATVGVDALAFRDVVVLAAAVLGVGGSYLLYRRRRADAAERLRSALYAEVATMGEQIADEVRQMESAELTDDPYVPEESPIVPTVYRNSAVEFGRLTAEEVEALTLFYAAAELIDDRFDRVRAADELSAVEAMYLHARLVELLRLNETALNALEATIDEPLDRPGSFGEPARLTFDEIRDGLPSNERDPR